MLLAHLILAAVVVTPTPSPTPAPHGYDLQWTIQANQIGVRTGGSDWIDTGSSATQLAITTEAMTGLNDGYINRLRYESLHSTFTVGPYVGNWNQVDFEDEFDWEWGPPWNKWGAGVAYLTFSPIDSSGERYHSSGFGIGLDRFPDYVRPISAYGGVWWYPNEWSRTADFDRYGVWEYDAGLNIRSGPSNPFSYRIGYYDQSWYSRTGNGNFHFGGPYLGVTYRVSP